MSRGAEEMGNKRILARPDKSDQESPGGKAAEAIQEVLEESFFLVERERERERRSH